MASPIVLAEYKRAIAEHFDARTDYSRSKTHARLANRLVRLAAPQPDERVLDIATGTGFVAILAAQLVGERGYGRRRGHLNWHAGAGHGGHCGRRC